MNINKDLGNQEMDENALELFRLQQEIMKLEQEALGFAALRDEVERQQERIEVLNVKIQKKENANESLRKKIGS